MKVALLISALLLGFSSDQGTTQFLPTKLKITVVDVLGNNVADASVSIYENAEDYFSNENAAAVGTTDMKGQVTFKDMKLIPYFIDAKKEDQSNKGEGIVTGTLLEGRVNNANTVIE